MSTEIVITMTGSDRVGLVEDITRILLELGGNVSTSRMARLGGEFTALILVTVPARSAKLVGGAFADLTAQGYRVTATPTRRAQARKQWRAFTVRVTGADHEGIIHDIASGLSSAGITIEAMDTGVTEAPVSGSPLFMMTAHILVPPPLSEEEWMGALEEAGRKSGVEIEVAEDN